MLGQREKTSPACIPCTFMQNYLKVALTMNLYTGLLRQSALKCLHVMKVKIFEQLAILKELCNCEHLLCYSCRVLLVASSCGKCNLCRHPLMICLQKTIKTEMKKYTTVPKCYRLMGKNKNVLMILISDVSHDAVMFYLKFCQIQKTIIKLMVCSLILPPLLTVNICFV